MKGWPHYCTWCDTDLDEHDELEFEVRQLRCLVRTAAWTFGLVLLFGAAFLIGTIT